MDLITCQRGKGHAGCLIGILAFLILGVGGAVFVGKFGMNVFEEEVKKGVRDNPVVLEHVGNIEEIDWNLPATGAAEGDDTFVFDVVGSKGRGELTVRLRARTDGLEEILSGSLRLASGEAHDLFPPLESPPPPAKAPVEAQAPR